MKGSALILVALGAVLFLAGCGVYHRQGLDPGRLRQVESALTGRRQIPPDLEQKVLALDPERVTGQDVRELLSPGPAPHIFNIHGGISWVIPRMVSFSEFLVGMGYPVSSLTNPSDGTYSFSCYESSDKIAGVIAWYYERDGLRPMMIGHSQGGMQAIKVLYALADQPSARLHVWNPLTWEKEKRTEIRDPLTGQLRPVVGLQVSYVASVGAGGLTRILPNQWDMCGKLRTIPDSAVEFTGFCKKLDALGGDMLGYGAGNYSKPSGAALVRNVWLPTEYKHGSVPDTKHLLQDPTMVAWIDRYRPSPDPVSEPLLDAELTGDTSHILWAAEVWHRIKKHWVLELQRLIRARQAGAAKNDEH